MSCTIFYKGKLKRKYQVAELFEVIIDKIKDSNWKYRKEENCLTIDLNDGKSEPMQFQFHEHTLKGFCKVFCEENTEYDRIFDLFFHIQNMFFYLNIDDDFGMWADYLANKTPPKIKLRELTEQELKLIQRFDKEAESSSILLGIIGMEIKKSKDDVISYQYLVEHINPNVPSYFMEETGILETWVYETMTFKNYGRVCDINMDTRGLRSSLLAFSFGIAETMFGFFGGSTGPKQADIRKLYELEIYNKKIDLEKDHVLMFRYVLSVLEYLGFKHMNSYFKEQ